MQTFVPSQHVRVLLIEGNDASREALRTQLESAGYAVIEAPDGVVALDLLRTLSYPMVVLASHDLPRLDAPGLFNFLADEGLVSRHALIDMIPANRVLHSTVLQQLTQLDVITLRKPFTVDQLLSAVAEAARRTQSRTYSSKDISPTLG